MKRREAGATAASAGVARQSGAAAPAAAAAAPGSAATDAAGRGPTPRPRRSRGVWAAGLVAVVAAGGALLVGTHEARSDPAVDEPTDFVRRAETGTESAAAWRAFTEGERAFRVGQYGLAVDAFRDAVEADSAFAAAHYRLSRAAAWTHALEAAEGAVQRIDGLAEPDRRRLRGGGPSPGRGSRQPQRRRRRRVSRNRDRPGHADRGNAGAKPAESRGGERWRRPRPRAAGPGRCPARAVRRRERRSLPPSASPDPPSPTGLPARAQREQCRRGARA